jgi:NAD(P)H dehydrogenase (quinone)
VLTGPEALRFSAVATKISAVFARKVDYADQPPAKARELMLASGVSPWQADGNLELFEWIRAGGAETATATVREVTGADPQPVEDWLDDARASFLDPVPGLPLSFF